MNRNNLCSVCLQFFLHSFCKCGSTLIIQVINPDFLQFSCFQHCFQLSRCLSSGPDQCTDPAVFLRQYVECRAGSRTCTDLGHIGSVKHSRNDSGLSVNQKNLCRRGRLSLVNIVRKNVDDLHRSGIHFFYIGRHKQKTSVIFRRLDICSERGIAFSLNNQTERLLIRLDCIPHSKYFFNIFS